MSCSGREYESTDNNYTKMSRLKYTVKIGRKILAASEIFRKCPK
jgi:hypothetical protein